MIKNHGQLHGVAADPRMRDDQPLSGIVQVIPALNRLAQHHERYRAWVEDQYNDQGDLDISFEVFDADRTDFWSDLYDSADEVVQCWLAARGSAPVGQ